jgi:hypothetical protein
VTATIRVAMLVTRTVRICEERVLRFAVIATAPMSDDDIVVVRNARDGNELHRIAIPSRVTALAFDDRASQLLVATSDRLLRTIDLSDGVVVGEVSIDAGGVEGPGAIGILPDGSVRIIGTGAPGRAQVVDRLDGRVLGPALEIGEAVEGRSRPDGTLVTWGRGTGIDVIDPGVDALVDRAVALAVGDARLANNSVTVYTDGQRVTIPGYLGGERTAVFDLRTGERGFAVLRTQDGQPFPEFKTYALDGGLAAFSENRRVGLWIDGVHVDDLVIPSRKGGILRKARATDPYLLVVEETAFSEAADHHLLEAVDGRIHHRFTVERPLGSFGAPMPDGGLLIFSPDGVAERWDAAGELQEGQTFRLDHVWRSGAYAFDDRGRVAYIRADAPGGLSRIEIRDLERSEMTELTAPGLINGIGFARGGELLALQGVDGSVRLMDVETGATSGVLWIGDGTQFRTPWYEEATDSIWVAARDELVRLPIDPAVWRERACERVSGELTEVEWQDLVPGNVPQVPACPDPLGWR